MKAPSQASLRLNTTIILNILQKFFTSFSVTADVIRNAIDIYQKLLFNHYHCQINYTLLSNSRYIYVVIIIAHRAASAQNSAEEYVNALFTYTGVEELNDSIYQILMLSDMLLL
jgi:hypothetical protein